MRKNYIYLKLISLILIVTSCLLLTGCKTFENDEYGEFLEDIYFELDFIDEYTIDMTSLLQINIDGEVANDELNVHIETSRIGDKYTYYLKGESGSAGNYIYYEIWCGEASDGVEYVLTKTNFGVVETRKEVYDDLYSGYPMAQYSLPTILEKYLDKLISNGTGETSSLSLLFKTYTMKKAIKTASMDASYSMKFRNSRLQSVNYEADNKTSSITSTHEEMTITVSYESNIVIPNPDDFETKAENQITNFDCIVNKFGALCDWKNAILKPEDDE